MTGAAPESEEFLDKIKRILEGRSTVAEREAAFARKPSVTATPKSEKPEEEAKDAPANGKLEKDGSEA